MKKFQVSLTVASILLGASTANAQLEEVFVTATKRAESIQDVPLSVAFVGGDLMDRVGVSDMEDLSILVPNFEINSSGIIPNLYIRGLGGGTTHSIEQSVGRFIDGVYIGRAVVNLHPFIDIASVEVLRGPQGTLFGKNTAAGALVMRTNKPTEEFEAGLDLSYGAYDTTGSVTEVNGFVSGGLTDNVAGRLAFIYKDKEGFYENGFDGPDGEQKEDYGLVGQLKIDVGENTVIGLKAQYMEMDADGSDVAEMNTIGGPPLFVWQGWWQDSGVPAAQTDQYTAGLDWKVFYNCGEATSQVVNGSVPIGAFCPSREQDSSNLTLDIDHELDAGTIKLIAAYQDYDYTMTFHALDQGAGNLFRGLRAEEYDGISTELRFTSNEGDSFDYIAGLYYEDSDISRRQESDLNIPFGPGTFARSHEPWNQQTETFAVFGQTRVFFTDQITGIFGGRWSTETKDFQYEDFITDYQTNDNRRQGISLRSESRDESRFTPSVAIQFDVNDDVNVYASYARGHKTGGFSDRVDSQDTEIQFDEEIHDGFEFGMKGVFLDDQVSLNVAFFHTEIEGLQLSTIVEGTANSFVVDNAADSISKGVEVEANWFINDSWTVGANYAYTDATYDEFVGLEGCGGDFRDENGVCDLSGETLQYAPENKAAAYVEYYAEAALAGWDIGARADISYTDDQYTDVSLADYAFSGAHELYGASLRLVSPSDKITVSLIGRNLSNEEVNAWSVGAGPSSLSTMSPPRLVTLKAAFRF
ncbi:MAG: TonB-dependent receptor [Halioglobus sp.]